MTAKSTRRSALVKQAMSLLLSQFKTYDEAFDYLRAAKNGSRMSVEEIVKVLAPFKPVWDKPKQSEAKPGNEAKTETESEDDDFVIGSDMEMFE